MATDTVKVNIVTNTGKSQKGMLKFAAAAAAAAIAIGVVIKVGKKLVDTYAVQEQAEARLAATIRATGSAANLTSDELLKMASGLQDVTKFGDESIIGAQSLLLTFKNIGEETFPRALESILNVSEAMGTGLKESSIQLGKALNDPVGGIAALTRVGIQFTDEQKNTIKTMVEMNDTAGAQNVILEELESQFGGVARAAGDTATGSFKQLGNSLGDVQEEIGGLVANGLEPFNRAMTPVITSLGNWIRKLNEANKITKDLEDGVLDENVGLETLQETLDILNKRRSVAAAEARFLLDKEIIQVKDLISNFDHVHDRINKNATARLLYANITDNAAAKQEIINNMETHAAKELEKLRFDLLTTDEKRLEIIKEEINELWQYRDIAEVMQLINTLAVERNGLLEIESDIFKGKTPIAEEWRDAELARIFEINAAEQEAAKATIELAKEKKDALLSVFSELSTSMSAFSDLAVLGNENEIMSLDAKIKVAEAAGESTETLEAAKGKLLEENWKREKAFSLTQAIINTALSVSKSLTALPAPFNIPLGVLAAAAGAAQIAVIAGTAMPSFATGGSFIADHPQLIQVGEGAGSEKITVEQAGGSSGGGTYIFRLLSPGGDFLAWIQREGIDNRGLRSSRGGAI